MESDPKIMPLGSGSGSDMSWEKQPSFISGSSSDMSWENQHPFFSASASGSEMSDSCSLKKSFERWPSLVSSSEDGMSVEKRRSSQSSDSDSDMFYEQRRPSISLSSDPDFKKKKLPVISEEIFESPEDYDRYLISSGVYPERVEEASERLYARGKRKSISSDEPSEYIFARRKSNPLILSGELNQSPRKISVLNKKDMPNADLNNSIRKSTESLTPPNYSAPDPLPEGFNRKRRVSIPADGSTLFPTTKSNSPKHSPKVPLRCNPNQKPPDFLIRRDSDLSSPKPNDSISIESLSLSDGTSKRRLSGGF